MNDRERFLAICRGERPDCVPIFGFPGSPGMSRGAMKLTHDRLVATGMPAHVGGCYINYQSADVQSWYRYWGTTGPLDLDFSIARGAAGFKESSRVEDGFEIIESESGAITRQVLDNDITYSMPEFVRFPVRDRDSWELYKKRTEPIWRMSAEEREANCRRFDDRAFPLEIGAGSTYGLVRGLMGTEAASLALYDDPELIHDIIFTHTRRVREYAFPLIERLRPEIVAMSEDLCYNHGMLLSPAQFDEFCGPHYREVCDCAFANGATLVTVDTDGNLMESARVAGAYGVNGLHPCEVKAGNDLIALREDHPELTLFGWLEKEVVNEGNEAMIEPEIMSKVAPLLETGRYFPNGDHGIQPPVSFGALCRFMTLLHEACSNPEGEFPRA